MTTEKAEFEQLIFPVVSAEVNFLNYPFFCLAKQNLNSTASIEYRSTIQQGDQRVDILWKVLAQPEFGFPGPFDKDLHRAMEALITYRGFPVVNPIPVSFYKLGKIMGINPQSGKNIEAMKEALLRIASTSVLSKQAFYSKAEEQWVEELFHLYDYVTFKGKSRPDTHEIAETNYVFLGKWYLDNLNAFYIKTLDYDFYKSLKSPTDKRYYEIMSIKFYGAFQSKTPFLRFRYSTLCSLFPLTRHTYLSYAKRQLEPSHKRLIKAGFFSKVTWHKTSDKHDWLIYFHPGAKAHDLLNPEKSLKTTEIESLGDFDADKGQLEFSFVNGVKNEGQNSQDKFYKSYKYYSNNNNRAIVDESTVPQDSQQNVVVALSDKLKTLGLPEKLISKYVSQFSASYLNEKIAIVGFRKSRDQRIKNSGGMLRKAIEEDWQPPEELTAATEKLEKQIETHERLQAEEKQAAMEEAKNKAVEEWISKASDELLAETRERAALEVREENPETKDQFLRILFKIRESEIIASEYINWGDNSQVERKYFEDGRS